MRILCSSFLLGSLALLTGCDSSPKEASTPGKTASALVAPGAPGDKPVWAFSGKTGIGTSYEAYRDGHYHDNASTGTVSKVWFSLAEGIITETMYGMIHEAQIKDIQFFIQGKDFLHEESKDTVSHIEYLHTDAEGRPLSLAYKIINRDKQNRYEIEKHVFTDPDGQSLVFRVLFRAHDSNITPWLHITPQVANTGINDKAWQENGTWYAQEGSTTLAVKTDAPVANSTVGFMGQSDGITQLQQFGKLQHAYTTTGDSLGHVGITLQLPELNNESADWQFAIGFGDSPANSAKQADATLKRGYETVLAHYNGEGEHIGWQDYLQSLPQLPALSAVATDQGKLLYASALVLKAQEDKTHAGALIASLSNPWGDTVPATTARTGYKAVWPRDFYQVAMAMLALGDRETPKVAFEYLQKVQVTENTPGFSGAPGWFLQKTRVDGELEWIAIQMDQTAMPIMLGWRLWKDGVLTDEEAVHWFNHMLKPAADFLADGGKVKLDWVDIDLKPPFTQQERWEEQQGYSPSSTAAIVAGLITAADLAKLAGNEERAAHYLQVADRISGEIESTMFTTQGSLTGKHGDGRYYLRITENTDPNDRAPLATRNGREMTDESLVIDGGFLELVRYGVRPANDAYILETLPELDNQSLPDDLRVKYEFTFPGVDGSFPGWRRYGIDGYGEDINTGLGYGAVNEVMSLGQRGRVWPFFTGERAHYELAHARATDALNEKTLGNLRSTYVKGLELFANEGLMLPEQVWDGVGNNEVRHYAPGQGTNSATPLAWTHAEYVKLLRSLHDKTVWDHYPLVEQHFQQ